MKHAFIITAYKNAQQLNDLVSQLDDADAFFYIHIDKRSDLLQSPALDALKTKKNVFFHREPVKVYWGGFSHLKSFVMLLEEVLRNRQIDYVHTISAQCFPTMSFKKFDEFFVANNGNEYISWMELPSKSWTGGGLDRIQYYHLNDVMDPKKMLYQRFHSRFINLQKKLRIRRRLNTYFPKFYGGGTWWSLSRPALDYVFEQMRQKPGLFGRFKHTHCAEEIFFQTILMNSAFKDKIVSDDLRYIDWSTRNGNCPANLDETDFEKIIASNKLFARKFELPLSAKLAERLREKIDSEE